MRAKLLVSALILQRNEARFINSASTEGCESKFSCYGIQRVLLADSDLLHSSLEPRYRSDMENSSLDF
jgi:hypothetical protein